MQTKEKGIMSPPELRRYVAEEDEITLQRREWGPWLLETRNLTLTYLPKKHDGKGREYEIDLEKVYDSTGMLDWIMQVASKTWSDTEILGWLTLAFYDIFNPQRTMCGWSMGPRGTGYRKAPKEATVRGRVLPPEYLEVRYG